MSIGFNSIPKSRIPFIYVEFDNSKAQRYDFDIIYRVLLIGKKDKDSKAQLLKPLQVKTLKEAQENFGASELTDMVAAFLKNSSQSKLFAVAVEDENQVLNVFESIKDTHFHLIVNPFVNTLEVLQLELSERFSPARQVETQMISAVAGDPSEIVKKYQSLTSPHITLLACGKKSPTPSQFWAAALAGVVANFGQADPAAPFKSCKIEGVTPPEEEDRYTRGERDLLLKNGLSTWHSQSASSARVELLVTTYKNDQNESDESYLYLNTLLVCMAIRHSFTNYFAAKYARAKLADDGAFLPSGVQMLTPKIGKSEAINLFKTWEEKGWVSGLDDFKNSLIVERNKKDPTRLDFYLEPRFVSQLNVIGTKISFLF